MGVAEKSSAERRDLHSQCVCRGVTTRRNDVAEAPHLLREANLLIGARLRFHLLRFATVSARADGRLEQFAWGISLERGRV
jgi:hypothetical protein